MMEPKNVYLHEEADHYSNFLRECLKLYYYNPSTALWRALEIKLLSGLNFKSPLLDIGCGDGLVSSMIFAKKIDFGIDISEKEVLSAKKLHTYKNLTVGNACKMPYKDESFATVFSNCVIEHIPNLDRVLGEVSRILQRGGKFIFTVPSEMFEKYLFFYDFFRALGLIKLANRHIKRTNERLHHFHYYNPKEWKRKLNNFDMDIIDFKYYLPPPSEKLWDIIDSFFGTSIHGFQIARILKHSKKTVFRNMLVPIFEKFLLRFYNLEGDSGGALLIVAIKQ